MLRILTLITIIYAIAFIIHNNTNDKPSKPMNCDNKERYGGECRVIEIIEHEEQKPIIRREK